MVHISLYNLIHGPEIWLGISILCGIGVIICISGLLFSLSNKEDEPDDRN